MRRCYKKTSWLRKGFLFLVPLISTAIFTGCSDDYLAIVAVSPGSVLVSPGQEVTFTAAVVGLEDKSVEWAVNDQIGGDDEYGTITEDGLYTAPSKIPDDATVRITAMCAGDESVYGTATATIVSISVEMEDYLTSYDQGGVSIHSVGCSGASGGRAVEGFDMTGDYLTFQVVFAVPGRYTATLRQAALSGWESQVKITLEGAGSDGSDQEALFNIVGRGIT